MSINSPKFLSLFIDSLAKIRFHFLLPIKISLIYGKNVWGNFYHAGVDMLGRLTNKRIFTQNGIFIHKCRIIITISSVTEFRVMKKPVCVNIQELVPDAIVPHGHFYHCLSFKYFQPRPQDRSTVGGIGNLLLIINYSPQLLTDFDVFSEMLRLNPTERHLARFFCFTLWCLLLKQMERQNWAFYEYYSFSPQKRLKRNRCSSELSQIHFTNINIQIQI